MPERLEEHKDSVMTRIQRDYQAESLSSGYTSVIVVAAKAARPLAASSASASRKMARVWGIHPGRSDLCCDKPSPKQKVWPETGKPARAGMK